MSHNELSSSAGAPRAGDLDFLEAPSFFRISGAVSEGLVSAETESLASEIVCAMPASPDFFKISPSVLGASTEAVVDAFTDSITVSSMLVILLFLGVVVGILDAFGSSVMHGGLRAISFSTTFYSFGSSAGSVLASTGIERLGSDIEADPSISFGTSIVSMRLGRCVKTLTFFDFGALEVTKVAVFLFFPCFCEV
jgi:hypothetical protein